MVFVVRFVCSFRKLHAPTTMASLSDDPDTLLNEWLGELDNLIGVSTRVHERYWTELCAALKIKIHFTAFRSEYAHVCVFPFIDARKMSTRDVCACSLTNPLTTPSIMGDLKVWGVFGLPFPIIAAWWGHLRLHTFDVTRLCVHVCVYVCTQRVCMHESETCGYYSHKGPLKSVVCVWCTRTCRWWSDFVLG